MSILRDHVAALILQMAEDEGGALTVFADELPNRFRREYSIRISDEIINDAVRLLDEMEANSKISSPLTGDFVQIRPSMIYRYYDDGSEPTPATPMSYDINWEKAQNELPVLKAHYFGKSEWASRVVGKLQDPAVLEGLMQNTDGGVYVPASDRVVSLDHNSADLGAIKQAASELRAQLLDANDVGDLTFEEVQVAAMEVAQLEQQLAAPGVRIGALRERATSTLSWIGQQAAAAAIGTAAMALLAAIAAFFGFAL